MLQWLSAHKELIGLAFWVLLVIFNAVTPHPTQAQGWRRVLLQVLHALAAGGLLRRLGGPPPVEDEKGKEP